MTTACGSGWGLRGGASVAVLLHLLLVGFVPMGEAFHGHVHVSEVEWHSDGSHQHGDEPGAACPLLLGAPAPGVISEAGPAVECPLAEVSGRTLTVDLPRPADPPTSVTARGPPAA